MVLATQNPIEYEGTFPLPEAQLDRFLMRVHLGYPTNTDEVLMMDNQQMAHPIESLEQVTDAGKLVVRMGAWLKDPEARKAVADMAPKALDTLVGALDRTVAAIDPYLMEFRLQQRSEDA